MTEPGARLRSTRRSDVPRIEIVSGYRSLAEHPVTIFEVTLIAGDADDATLVVRTRVDEDPLICLHARAGGIDRFVPAAPTVIGERLQIYVCGDDAAGSIAYR